MIAAVVIEHIGACQDWVPGVASSRPWVAWRPNASRRVFLRGRADYRDANSNGSRGVKYHYVLELDGIYEACGRTSWSKMRRWHLVKIGSKIIECETFEEALVCLAES